MTKLRGEAQEKLFVQYAFNSTDKDSKFHFLRFMFASKSNSMTVRRLFNHMTLQQHRDGYSITVQKPNIVYSQVSVEDEMLQTMFKFIQPQNFTISINSDANLKRWNGLLPHVLGANKLFLDADEPEMIPFVQQLAGHLRELTCSANALMLPEFPLMKLDKFSLLSSFPFDQSKFEQIFRHEIKELDLTSISDTDLKGLNFSDGIVGPQCLTRLILSIYHPSSKDEIMLFVERFHERVPTLSSLELNITAPQHYVNINDLISTQLIEIYNDIIAFKERAPAFLQTLFIKFTLETFAIESDDYELDWMDVLKKANTFKNAEFVIDPVNNQQSMKLKQHKTTGSKVFSIDFEFTFVVMSDEEHQQAIEDNLDVDEFEVGYDYDDDASDYDDFD